MKIIVKKPLWLVVVALFVVGGCNKPEILSETDNNVNNNESQKDIWEWKNVHDTNSTVTLIVYEGNVSVTKSPKEDGYYDHFHQFRDGDQYLLQNDTLYLKNLDGTVVYPPVDFFKITRFSEDEMKLEYLGAKWAMPLYIYDYVFNRKIIE
ncbi:MAG: hypothetical protein GX330_05685 [Bacteroidales bacterium]|nr:hypothetical protein [Bacteroidales bacterium]